VKGLSGEVHDHDSRLTAGLPGDGRAVRVASGVDRGGLGGAGGVYASVQPGAAGLGRAGRDPRPERSGARSPGPVQGGGSHGHRRPLRRGRGPAGPYQLQAAIAAVHDEAASAGATDWPQIAALYEVLLRLDDNPVVALNHAVAVSMTAGARAGLELIQQLEADPRINADRRFHAVRAHLLETVGEHAAALEAYRAAARAATNLQQQRYLNQQINRLAPGPGVGA
jgi:hypothetical protein